MTNASPSPSALAAIEAIEHLQAIIDWADFALSNPKRFDSHEVRNLDGPIFDDARVFLKAALVRQSIPPADPAMGDAPFQKRVDDWVTACFGDAIRGDKVERNHRFIEEALELVQSTGCAQSEAHQLVDYVYGRPAGDPAQEVGGVLNTLAALCNIQDIDMVQAGDIELARCWKKIKKIRAKQATKPKHSPLPEYAIGDRVLERNGDHGKITDKVASSVYVLPDSTPTRKATIGHWVDDPADLQLEAAALAPTPKADVSEIENLRAALEHALEWINGLPVPTCGAAAEGIRISKALGRYPRSAFAPSPGQPVAVSKGWKLTRIYPTPEMMNAARSLCGGSCDIAHAVWTEMLAAAPTPPSSAADATQGGNAAKLTEEKS